MFQALFYQLTETTFRYYINRYLISLHMELLTIDLYSFLVPLNGGTNYYLTYNIYYLISKI